MLSARKGVMATLAIITFFFLIRSLRSSPPVTADARSFGLEPSNRRYPPRITHNLPASQIPMEDMSTKPLRERLRYQFPYDREAKFPGYIWQTWKYNPSSGNFGQELRPMEASWTELHPGFVHEVITDDAAEQLIKYLYASVPEVVEAYASLPLPVLKADLFRYLILLARGGIYSDIDTQALKPTMDWLPRNFDRSTIGLVIGIEADPDRPDWAKWYSRRIQFCQWTIQAKPGHPALRDLVASITEDTLRMKKLGILKDGKMDKSIVEFTGPAVFTDAVFAYLNNELFFDFGARQSNVSHLDFSGMKRQKKIGDIAVLPITSFSPGVEQMGAQGPDDPMAFVMHQFAGVWKPKSERMNNNP